MVKLIFIVMASIIMIYGCEGNVRYSQSDGTDQFIITRTPVVYHIQDSSTGIGYIMNFKGDVIISDGG